MVDVLYIATIIAFFVLMVGFVHLCERIVGKDDAVDLPYNDLEDDAVTGTVDTDSPTTTETHEEMTV